MALTETDKLLLLGALGTSETTKRVVDLLNAAGTGDIAGPISSVDNTIPRFDGITGKVLQNSGIIINDSNDIIGANELLNTGRITVNNADIRITSAFDTLPLVIFTGSNEGFIQKQAPTALNFGVGAQTGLLSIFNDGHLKIGELGNLTTHIVNGGLSITKNLDIEDNFSLIKNTNAQNGITISNTNTGINAKSSVLLTSEAGSINFSVNSLNGGGTADLLADANIISGMRVGTEGNCSLVLVSNGSSEVYVDPGFTTIVGTMTIGGNPTLQHEINGLTAATASAGTNGAPPAQVEGYLVVYINGVEGKIPYYTT